MVHIAAMTPHRQQLAVFLGLLAFLAPIGCNPSSDGASGTQHPDGGVGSSGGSGSSSSGSGSSGASGGSGSSSGSGSGSSSGSGSGSSDAATEASPDDSGVSGDSASAGDSAGGSDSGVGITAPTVVATLDYVPASLALSGANLYVTVGSASGIAGKVQTLPKTASGATPDGGTITTLASGLRLPGVLTVDGANVYWAGQELASGGSTIFAVPTAGGSVTEITPYNTITGTRVAIANSVLYAFSNNYGSVSAYPLTGGAAGAGQVIYSGISTTLGSIDSDGTSVVFTIVIAPYAGQSGEIDIYQVPVGGGAFTVLSRNVAGPGNNVDIVHDATSIYWTEQVAANGGVGNVYSIPKAGGTRTLLASFPYYVRLALDGNDLYMLGQQSLSRIAKTGGTPVVLASYTGGGSADYYGGVFGSSNYSVSVVVDDTYVYWLRGGHSQILKVAR